MKAIFSPLYWLMGAVFLLITTVFWNAISGSLLAIQEQTTVPSFWNLAAVLSFVRLVFIIVGIFLLAFGIGVFLFRKR